MKKYFKCKLKSLSENKRRKREFLSTVRRRRPSTTWRKPKRQTDSMQSKQWNNNLLTDRLMSSWKSEINKKKFSTSRSQKLRTKLLHSLLRRNAVKVKWNRQSREVERTKLTEWDAKKMAKRMKNWNSQNSGSSEMKSWPSLNVKKRKKIDKEELKCPTTWKNKFQIKIEKLKKILSWNSTLPLETMLC